VLIPGKRAEEVNVYEIMTKPILSVPADMDIRYIARLLHRVGMRRAPVEENGDTGRHGDSEFAGAGLRPVPAIVRLCRVRPLRPALHAP
jgi:CBS domain-containing protein